MSADASRPRGLFSRRVALSLLLLALCLSCSIRDPAGTRWTTVLSIATQPETLRVSSVLDNANVALGPDSLLLIHQPLDTVWANFGDSLIWAGATGSLEWRLGRLDLHGLGSGAAGLPFVAAWPQYAGLVGQTAQITGEAECDLLLDLPPWPDMEWVAFASADFALDLLHDWPFPLAWLELDLVNAQGLSLGSRRIEPVGGIPAGQPRTDQLAVAGLVSRDCRVRVRARHLPMPAPALIQNDPLEIGLTQTTGQADSARAVIPAQHFAWSDSLAADTRMRIRLAHSGPVRLHLSGQNGTPLDIDLMLDLPQLTVEATEDTLQLSLPLAAGGAGARQEEPGALRLEDQHGLRFVRVEARGSSTTGAGLVTVRADDRVSLDVACEPSRLRDFEGWFTQDLIIPILPSETPIEAWPVELAALRLEGLDLRLHLLNNTAAALQSLLVLGVESGLEGFADTTYIFQPALAPLDSLLVIHDMGSLPERLPTRVNMAGSYRVPAGVTVSLDEHSRIGVTDLSVPGRGRLSALAWRSLPEIHNDRVPEEAGQIRLEGQVENRLPAGGRIRGRVAAHPEAESIPLFDIQVASGHWNGTEVEPALDTLSLDLAEQAVEIMRLPEWVLWYEFEADESGDEVEIHAGQWLAIQALIRVDVDIHPGEN